MHSMFNIYSICILQIPDEQSEKYQNDILQKLNRLDEGNITYLETK